MERLVFAGLFLFIIGIAAPLGCGRTVDSSLVETSSDSPSAPTITSLKNSSGTTLASGDNIGTSDSLKIVFSETMLASSLNTSTLALTDEASVSVAAIVTEDTDSDGIEGNEFSINPDANLKQLSSYTFSVVGGADGVQTASGGIMEGNESYQLSTVCEFSDDFSNAETIAVNTGCYEFASPEVSDTSESVLPQFLSVTEGALTFSTAKADTLGTQRWITKSDSGDHSYTVTIQSVSPTPSEGFRVGLTLTVASNFYGTSLFVTTATPGGDLHVFSFDGLTNINSGILEDGDFPLTLKIERTGDRVSTFFKTARTADFTTLHSNSSFTDSGQNAGLYFSKPNADVSLEVVLDNYTHDE